MRKIAILLAFLLFAGLQGAFAQKTITGKVTSAEDGLGMAGVPVVVKGTTIGTATDIDGAFTLSVPANAAALVVSFIGMKTVEVPIGTQTHFDIVLEQNILALEDVVVTAFGISRQAKALTYAAQNVAPKALAEARDLNPVSGLSGRVAGLSVTTAGTGVGADAKVLMRGNRSIAGSSQPLYVIDGVPMGGISNLAPDDIVSISVLKGANAAALYGSRANNGVIIVTTKSGQGGAEGVMVDLGFTYQGTSAILLDKMQNEYGQGGNGVYSPLAIVSWGPKMDGSQVAHWTPDPNHPLYGKTYPYLPQPNNVKDYFQTGNSIATNLQVTINTARTNTAFSYTNTNASGIVASNNLHSHNLNLRFGAKLGEKFTLDSKVTVIKQSFENIFATGEGFDNPMRYLYVLPRNIRTEDLQHFEYVTPAGQVRQHYWRWNDNGTGNAYWTRNRVLKPQDRWRPIGMVSLKYQITKDLSIMGRSALDASFTQREEKWYNDTYTVAINGGYGKYNSSSYGWNSDFLINYHKALGDFVFDVNAGGNNYMTEYQMIGGSGVVFNIENLFALANTANPRPTEDYSKKVVNSLYGFAEISWKNAIFLNLTGRNDWSSTLPASNRSYFYPSFGLTAVVSDLITMPDFLTYLKLRSSYAIVGNDTGPYQLSRTAAVGTGGVITLSNVLPNANLKPETTKSTELGFDLRLIRDKIRFGFTWYNTNTFDQLFATPVPATSGVASIYQNGANVQNRGLELTLGAAVVEGKGFSWDIDINWAKNTSKILEIAEGFDELGVSTDFIRRYLLRAGAPFGEVYAKGWMRYENTNKVIIQENGIPAITPGMTVRVANFNPDWLAGISNTFRYKNFSFSSLIDFRVGGTFIAFTEAISAGSGIQEYTTIGRDGSLMFGRDVYKGLEGVTLTGEPNTKTCTSEAFWNNVGGRNNPTGEAFVRDATNIRMREMILGYDLPKSIVAKTFFRSARVSLVGRNLFFLMNKAEYCDPEIMIGTANAYEGENAFPLPTTRTYGVSLNFGF
ncbi:MAG TPA: SusC/RagA family TonB-linked outer membrane protein [Bacteroidales bacterium]|nr:SusC/RagA family TonB-linked outer membrane protein [Bacteroidales bacterium]HNR42780.1 SusC/RagA family TonB-linked outer membrane protein [Bacteroidales bacterium]